MSRPFQSRALIVLLCVALLSLLVLSAAGPYVWADLNPLLALVVALAIAVETLPSEPLTQPRPLAFRSLDASRAPPEA